MNPIETIVNQVSKWNESIFQEFFSEFFFPFLAKKAKERWYSNTARMLHGRNIF